MYIRLLDGAAMRRLFGRWWLTGLLVILAALASSMGRAAHAQDDFLDPAEAFVMTSAMSAPDRVAVHFRIAKGYYMYRERFAFTLAPDAALLGQPVFPRGTVKYDPTFDKDLEVYHNGVTIELPLKQGAPGSQTLTVIGQGCADAGLCYPPMNYTVQLVSEPGGYALQGKGVVAQVPPPQDEAPSASSSGSLPAGNAFTMGQVSDVGLASILAQAGWLQVVGLCLLLGVLLTFTPCVLPMVPIVLAVVAGDVHHLQKRSRLRGLGLAAVYVLGVSVVYTALGVAAGLAGAGLAAWLQTPPVLIVFALLLALLGLSMFDVFTVQAPVGLQSALSDRVARIPGGRVGGAFLMGMLSALIVGPCVAAPLAGVLLFISQTGDVALGGSALFAMAWGQGVLLLVLGATSGALLPKAGAWMDGVKRLFGMLLLATAWWMASPLLSPVAMILGWTFLALCGAILLGAFGVGARPDVVLSSRHRMGRAVLRTFGIMLAFWSAMQMVGLAAGGRDVLHPLAPFSGDLIGQAGMGVAAAGQSGQGKPSFVKVSSPAELDRVLAGAEKPVMLDFYADWCVSCIEMERFTFPDPKVAGLMSRMLLVQADVTRNTDDDRALLQRLRLFGPPGIIFFDEQGRPREDLRVIGFKNARDFSAVLERALAGSGSRPTPG